MVCWAVTGTKCALSKTDCAFHERAEIKIDRFGM